MQESTFPERKSIKNAQLLGHKINVFTKQNKRVNGTY